MSEEVIITLLEVAVAVLVIWLIAARLAWQELKAEARSETRWADHYHRENVALREKLTQFEKERKRREARWQELEDALLADWGDECDGLITEIGELKEQIHARDYVIGALKTQVRDSQQAGMTLQTVVAALYEQNEGLLAKVKTHGKPQQEPYPDNQRLAAYVGAGRAVEGDGEIPY
jgi:chromosome segregation ATPase